MKKIFDILFLALLTISCTSTLNKKEIDLTQKNLLFPYGKYEHQVNVKLNRDDKNIDVELSSFIVHQKDSFEGVGLALMGTTLFKFFMKKPALDINLTVFHKPLENKREEIKNYISLIYNLYQTPNTEIPPKSLKLKDPKSNELLDIELDDFDINQIPQIISIKHSKFKINVKQSDYELYEK